MAVSIDFNNAWLQPLLRNPLQEVRGTLNNNPYVARIMIPNYRRNIEEHYAPQMQGSLQQECQHANMPMPVEHFGVAICFEQRTEVTLYNPDLEINNGLCELMRTVGIVVLQNAHHPTAIRDYGHRNRFPHLQFHIDRSAKQDARYSMYTRDPFDEEQKHPRTASTIFIPNIVGQLQGYKEGTIDRSAGENIITANLFFSKEDTTELLNRIILEQRWDQPEGVGEIAMIDNATLLHASYYRNAQRTGYKIGVRYLSGFDMP